MSGPSDGPSFHGVSVFGSVKRKTSVPAPTSSSLPNPSVQRALQVAQRAVELDECGRAEEAFPLYQEAVALLLAAVKQDRAGNDQIKRAANKYLTRAEEIDRLLTLRKQQTKESPNSRLKKDARFNNTPLASTKGLEKGRASAAVPTGSRMPRRPDDYDYTGGRARKGEGGAAVSHGSVGRAGGMGERSGGNTLSSTGARPGRASDLEAIVMEEMLDRSPGVTWEQISGLEDAKHTLQEAVVLPNLRPDLFKGLRAPPRGVLLFGPPGTGKTLLAKAVASETGFAFFSISASSLVSKFLGEGEKMVRALFQVARREQPSVVFIDEIDSMLGQRKDQEHEATRRLKTEFLVQLDGAGTDNEDRILVMGATNLPWALDEAVLRRLPKKIFIPLPDTITRATLLKNLLQSQKHALTPDHLGEIVGRTAGYSCSDLAQVAKDAAMGPLRDLDGPVLRTVKENQLRPISMADFDHAIYAIRPSVSQGTVQAFEKYMTDNGYIRHS